MTPISKDPKRRIRRIQRWICNVATEFNGLPCYVACHRIESKENCGCLEAQHYECAYCAKVSERLTLRLKKADSLFSRELAWLCDYAIRITTDHGRATSRLGEVEGALGRMRSMVHRVVTGLSPYSTHATMAYALERAIGELEALRGEKKRR